MRAVIELHFEERKKIKRRRSSKKLRVARNKGARTALRPESAKRQRARIYTYKHPSIPPPPKKSSFWNANETRLRGGGQSTGGFETQTGPLIARKQLQNISTCASCEFASSSSNYQPQPVVSSQKQSGWIALQHKRWLTCNNFGSNRKNFLAPEKHTLKLFCLMKRDGTNRKIRRKTGHTITKYSNYAAKNQLAIRKIFAEISFDFQAIEEENEEFSA